ncbi:MAG: hypothetical protein JW934_00800 [Anaerolineae bacterium]|nr:hypothetical protein [Anaerolineae bacterium]
MSLGWSAIVLWAGMLVLAWSGARVQRKAAQDARPRPQAIPPLAIIGGFILPGLVALFPFVLLDNKYALAAGGLFLGLLVVGGFCVLTGPDR